MPFVVVRFASLVDKILPTCQRQAVQIFVAHVNARINNADGHSGSIQSITGVVDHVRVELLTFQCQGTGAQQDGSIGQKNGNEIASSENHCCSQTNGDQAFDKPHFSFTFRQAICAQGRI